MVLTSAMAELGEALQAISAAEKGTDADWLLYLLAVLLASNLEPVSQAQVARYLSHYRKLKGMGNLPLPMAPPKD
jgi:hypothetical protein